MINPHELSRNELEQKITEFVADAADKSVEKIGRDDNIYEMHGVDSLGSVAIFVDVAVYFGVPEPSEKTYLRMMDTVRKLADYVLETVI